MKDIINKHNIMNRSNKLLFLVIAAVAVLGGGFYLTFNFGQPVQKPNFPSPGLLNARTNQPVTEMKVDIRKLPSWVTYMGKPPARDLGSDQTIRLVKLTTDVCYNKKFQKNIELILNEAFLIPTIRDAPSWLYDEFDRKFPDVGHDKFLVIQGFARNISKDSLYDWLYADEYLFIKRPNATYRTRVYGPIQVGATQTGTFWINIPVRPEENTFKLLFCDVAHPKEINIDFTTNSTVQYKGNYSIESGLYISSQ